MNYKLILLKRKEENKQKNKPLINKKKEIFELKYEITQKLIYKLHSNYIKKYLDN